MAILSCYLVICYLHFLKIRYSSFLIANKIINPNHRGRGHIQYCTANPLIHFFYLQLYGLRYIFGPQMCTKWEPESLQAA